MNTEQLIHQFVDLAWRAFKADDRAFIRLAHDASNGSIKLPRIPSLATK